MSAPSSSTSDAGNDSSNPSSLSQLISTLAPVALYALIYLAVFLVVRRMFPRYYSPRSTVQSLPDENKSPKLNNSYFGWFKEFWQISDTYVLNHHTLDGYLFLRFLKMGVLCCFAGCIITWPVLFPVYATGGNTQTELNILSMSNVTNNFYRYFATAGCAILFYGFVLYMITRESIYYINIRQAYLMSAAYASRISSRTVLYTSVPEEYMDEGKIRAMLGEGVKKIWFASDCKELEEKVDDRDSAAFKLEGAETKLIKTANKNRLKAEKKAAKEAKKGKKETTEIDSGVVEAGNQPADQFIGPKDRPTHKLGKFGLYGKKVDSIDWCRAELQRLIPEVDALQAKHRAGDAKKLNSVFVEFFTLVQAQEAYQSLTHHQALHMAPRYCGFTPDEVIWGNLGIKWWERVIRGLVTTGFVCALIIFWAIPVAAVGIISNVKALTNELTFLRFLNNLPDKLIGIVQGLLPTILLAVLLSLVPIIMRLMAKLSGCPTTSAVELRTQGWFFAFLVIQGFLVVTIASSATAVVTKIVQDPTSAPGLLAQNLPKASNFYISYFCLQGLAVVSGILLGLVGLIIFQLLSKFLDGTPRKMYRRWMNLAGLSWGTMYPTMTLFFVIAICYAAIAPLVLGFATLCLLFFYIAYRYNILYVTNAQIDGKGLFYTNALQHLFVGLYLSQLCLIALFAIGVSSSVGALGPLILMIIMLIFTILYQGALNAALKPLLTYLPKSLAAEEQRLQALESGSSASANGGAPRGDSYASEVAAKEERSNGKVAGTSHDEPASSVPPTDKKVSFVARWLRPDIHSDYAAMRQLVPRNIAVQYDAAVEDDAFFNPAITSPTPLLWIPRDQLGLSRRAVADTGAVIPITDEGAHLDAAKNSIVWNAQETPRPPIYEEKIYY